MIRVLKILALIMFAPSLSLAEEQSTQINYIGFNLFKADKSGENIAIFDQYVENLMPIMERHGLTLETYRVVHGGSDRLDAHAVTFGTAPDQQSFGELFADPEYQALFPTLVEIIEEHVVVFTTDRFSPKVKSGGDAILLAAAWLNGGKEESYETLLALEEETKAARRHHGVKLTARTRGVMSNRGLVEEIESIAPPDVLALWNISDPHGYYDDPSVIEFSKKASTYIENSAALWLVPWK